MKMLSNIWLIIALMFATSPLTAQMADYYVNVKTWDVWISWPDGGGTDNHIEMIIYGDRGNTGRFFVQGSSEGGKLEGFSIRKKDVGNINKILLDVDGQLADKWAVEYITITKGKNREDRNSEDGFYEFSLNKKLGYDPRSFGPTHVKKPRLQVSPSGATKMNKTYYTKVNFGHNPHSTADQEIMQYSETWQFVETVSISKTEENTTDASVTLGYESPETVYGKFSAEASASWGSMTSSTREDSEEKLQSSTYDWNYVAPANTAVFKKIVFAIPYGYQVYTDGKNSRVVRKLRSQVVPSGLDQFLFIPNMVNGKMEPVKWSTIEEEWLKHTDPQVLTDIIRQFKNKWLAAGYVYVNRKPTTTTTTSTTTRPTTTTTTTTRPTTTTTTTQVPIRSGNAPKAVFNPGTNGRNVKAVTYRNSREGGSFEQLSPGKWAEYKAGSRKVHDTFTELNPDDWSVYLRKSNGARIQIDLHTKKITYNGNYLFSITGSHKAGTATAPKKANGRNVVVVNYHGSQHGSFEQTSPGRWAEYKSGSRKVHATFTETGPDDWSVYLRKSDGARIQIDLHTKKITYNGGFLYFVGSSKAGR
jgi:hypothetical protein